MIAKNNFEFIFNNYKEASLDQSVSSPFKLQRGGGGESKVSKLNNPSPHMLTHMPKNDMNDRK